MSEDAMSGAVTNTVNLTTLTLAGNGTLSNRLASADVNSITNTLLLNSTNATWTMVDNPTATPVEMPTIFDVQAGTFSYGTGASAPQFVSTAAAVSRLGVIAEDVANTRVTFRGTTIALSDGAVGDKLIEAGRIEVKAPGTITVRAGKKSLVGPSGVPYALPQLPRQVCVSCLLKAAKEGSALVKRA